MCFSFILRRFKCIGVVFVVVVENLEINEWMNLLKNKDSILSVFWFTFDFVGLINELNAYGFSYRKWFYMESHFRTNLHSYISMKLKVLFRFCEFLTRFQGKFFSFPFLFWYLWWLKWQNIASQITCNLSKTKKKYGMRKKIVWQIWRFLKNVVNTTKTKNKATNFKIYIKKYIIGIYVFTLWPLHCATKALHCVWKLQQIMKKKKRRVSAV